jgi:hypothetical protein
MFETMTAPLAKNQGQAPASARIAPQTSSNEAVRKVSQRQITHRSVATSKNKTRFISIGDPILYRKRMQWRASSTCYLETLLRLPSGDATL